MGSLKRISKPCGQCGALMESVTPRRRYCPACRRERKRASWAAAYGKARAKKARRTPAESKHTRLRRILAGDTPPAREDHLTLGQVSMLADAAGMSYGKYVVKYGL